MDGKRAEELGGGAKTTVAAVAAADNNSQKRGGIHQTLTSRWPPDLPPSDFTPGPLPLTLQTCNQLVRSPVICALSRWESRMKERLQGTEGKQQ